MTYLGSLGYFLARGPMLLDGYSSEKAMLMGVPKCAAWFCTLSVCTYPPSR
jgi:hypothetical protein